MDVGALLDAVGPVLARLAADAPREDPAQDQLRLVIIALLGLALVLSVLTLLFWRATRPGRTGVVASATPSSRAARRDDEVRVREVWAPRDVADAPGASRRPPPPDPAPAPAPGPPGRRISLGSADAPWPPPRVARTGSARPPRPADPPDSLFGRLAALPDLEVVASRPPTLDGPAQDQAGVDPSTGRPTRSTSRS